jgi:hypothetical protein
MIVTANWEHTDTTVVGEQTEVIIPLVGLDRIDPSEDRIITQVVRDIAGEAAEHEPPWNKLRLDRGQCRLSILLGQTPDVTLVKRLVDSALRQASELLAENLQRRQEARAEAEVLERRRQEQAADLRHAFRGASLGSS